jgi:hypothetical protein
MSTNGIVIREAVPGDTLNEAFAIARGRNCGDVSPARDEGNKSAVEFYKGRGFQEGDIVLEKELGWEESDGGLG